MKYLTEKDDDISELEKDCANKFKWGWLEKNDKLEEKISVWCRKIDVPGTCFCIACNTSIKYKSEGLKALTGHSRSDVHRKARESVKNAKILHSFYPGAEAILENDETRTVDLSTRKARSEALILSFIAEHSLSFSLAPHIIELARTLARDVSALNSLEISRTTASYKLNYGLAKTVKEEQIRDLKNSFFSLNVDESTNKASESILAILVQYYSEEQKKVVLRHLASLKLPAGNSESIFSAIVSLIDEYELPWSQLISVLMDSCNTMRGKRNGVETKIRTQKAAHLLDIDGETCHTANNCAKKFTEPFLKHLEILCDNIYFDLKSTDKREIFFEICALLKLKPLKPLNRPDHRWLYILPVAERLVYLWDALEVFYFSWIGLDSEVYENFVNEIYEKRQLTAEEIKTIQNIQSVLKKKILTQDGRNRKDRIVQRLFVHKTKTLIHIAVYQAVLPHFNKYVKLFQSEECLLHELHVQMFDLSKQFFALFIKHELVSSMSTYEDILKIDATNSENYLPDKLIFTGVSNISDKISNSTMQEFMKVLKQSYSRCATYMQQKLPLNNSLLIKLSGLNPTLRGETVTFSALMKLAKFLPTVISEKDTLQLDLELRQYQTDSSLKLFENKPLMEFWNEVLELKERNIQKYPVLSKMIKAILTCFHGPAVESTFNLMDNIMSENRTSLNIETVDSIQTVKYYLSSHNKSTCDIFGSKNPTHEPINRELALNLLNSWSAYQKALSKNASQPSSQSHEESSLQCITPSTSSKNDTSKPAKASQSHADPPPQCIIPSTSVEKSSELCAEMPGTSSQCNTQEESRKRKLALNTKAKKQTKLSSFFKK